MASSRPDLILLDMNLPDGHGLQVIEALFEGMGAARIPVVALSADVMPVSIELARAAGCADYLTKPVDLGTLERLLAGYRQRIAPERAPDPSPGS